VDTLGADYARNYCDPSSIPQVKKFSEETEEKEDWDDESSDSSVTFSLSTGFVTAEQAAAFGEEYYQLNIPNNNIKLIDSIKDLEVLSKLLFSTAKIIGFDAEWKPVMCRAGEQDRVSILQLAVKDRVYIVDLFKLYVTPNAEDALKDFFTIFFLHQNTS